jgi:hypothetical protein
LLQGELKQLREHTVNTDRNKRSKRLCKERDQRSWNFDQVKKARDGKGKLSVPRIVKKTKKKLILALPSKKPD